MMRCRSSTNFRPRRRQQGVVAVELAFIIIPLMLMVFGVIEFGRAVYQYNTLAKAVRDGARMLTQHNPEDRADYRQRVEEARCLVAYGNTGCSGAPLVPGLDPDVHVAVCDRIDRSQCDGGGQYGNVPTEDGLGGAINLVEVRIVGFALPTLGLPVRLPFGTSSDTLAFNAISATMRQIR